MRLRRLGGPRKCRHPLRLSHSRDGREPQLLRPRRVRTVCPRAQEPRRRGGDPKPGLAGLRAGGGGGRSAASPRPADLRARGRRPHGGGDGRRAGRAREPGVAVGVSANRSHLRADHPPRHGAPCARDVFRDAVGRGEAAAREARRRSPARSRRGAHRRRRRHRGRRTHRQQDCDLDGGRGALTRRRVAQDGDGSRRPRPRAAGSHGDGSSRDLRDRRHRVARSGRSSAARRGAGRDAARSLCGEAD